ncbi:MAG TPA: phosphate/phosphite/phosphonate ABC transporter substrate-binding protein [Dehalococcoidia bacterium]|nr:phosphate/phosphite/phosphonate ABC transporter substrate-binding protein [Dehalococcoidia bacterium]
MRRALALALLGLLGLLAAACGSEESAPQGATQKLVVAVQPTLATGEMLEKARPLEQFLEQQLGDVDVEIYVPTSYAGIVEALRFGHAHVAFMSAWPSYLATRLADAELVLAEVREVIHGEQKVEAPYYYSYWVVRKDSPYTSLPELRGKKACFPSPLSTSGFVGPMGRLVELGLLQTPSSGQVDPKSFFSDYIFGGGYQQCWQALRSGQVDVSIIAGDVPEALYREVLANTRQLESQGPLPSHAVVFGKGLQEPLRSRALAAIEALGSPQQRDLMRQFISALFVGFQRSNAEEHLGALQRYLSLTRLQYTESLALSR